jgi:hypothetical protein
MDRPVELIPLTCLKCENPVPAGPEEVAWACRRCGQGLVLNPEKGLEKLEIHYQAGLNPNGRGKPFWVVQGQVTVERQTYSGNQASEAALFWSQPRLFFVPAYATPLENLIELGPQMLLKPFALQDGPRADFEPATLALNDLQPMVEVIVVAVEASRKDKLKGIQVMLQLSEPALWILP